MPISLISTENEATLADLLIAFEEESNAHALHAAFAVQADAEELHGVASLFRATALAEQIHANNHALVIRRLGGEAIAEIRRPEVRSTLENLKQALEGEVYAIDSMYPDFLSQTRSNDSSTARTFTWALESEKTHARLFSESIALLEAGKANSWISAAREFYVREVCGYLTKTCDDGRCWACSHFCKNFEVIH
jgi:rubrerythrin